METILCERCQVALNKTELMHVYRCPVCLTVTEQFPKDQTIVESDEKTDIFLQGYKCPECGFELPEGDFCPTCKVRR